MLHASMRERNVGLALWICPHFELTKLNKKVTDGAVYCEIGEPNAKQRKGHCPYCGMKLISAYFRESGLCAWVCPHTKIKTLDIVNKALYCSTITCDTQSMTYLKSRYPKAVTQAVNVRTLRVAFKELTKDTELTYGQLTEAVQNTASEESILEFANIAIMLGLPTAELPKLFEAAMRLGHATGIDTKSAIQALSIGVGRQSRMVLDNIGVMFKAEDAYKAFPRLDRVDAWKRYALRLITEKSANLSSDPKKIEKLQHDANIYDMHTKLGERLLQT